MAKTTKLSPNNEVAPQKTKQDKLQQQPKKAEISLQAVRQDKPTLYVVSNPSFGSQWLILSTDKRHFLPQVQLVGQEGVATNVGKEGMATNVGEEGMATNVHQALSGLAKSFLLASMPIPSEHIQEHLLKLHQLLGASTVINKPCQQIVGLEHSDEDSLILGTWWQISREKALEAFQQLHQQEHTRAITFY